MCSYLYHIYIRKFIYDVAKATICWNHVFHQKFPKMVCRRADHYHYPLYVLKDF